MSAWTGGHYSLCRGLLASYLAVRIVSAVQPGSAALVITGFELLAALLFGVGIFPRIAAIALASSWGLSTPALQDFLLEALLVTQAFVPEKPYGSWGARGRPDPGGGWRLSNWIPRLWQGLFLGVIGIETAVWLRALDGSGAAEPGLGFRFGWLVFLAFAFDPRWLAPRRAAEPEIAYYDGNCGLCHRFVRLCLSEDRDGTSFRFAPLQGPTFEERVPTEVRASMPDSFVLQRADGVCLVQSSATGWILCGLGGYWRMLGQLVLCIPRPLRDFGYATIARWRKALFAKPEGLCPLVPPHLGSRFLP